MTEKTKIYKEKILQLSKQLDTQRDIVKQKETAIDSLLTKLDGLADSNYKKTSQITTLRNENKLLKETVPISHYLSLTLSQMEGLRRDARASPHVSHSHKNSLDALKERAISANKKSDPAERSQEPQRNKRGSDHFLNEKKTLSATLGRGVFSSTDWTGKSQE